MLRAPASFSTFSTLCSLSLLGLLSGCIGSDYATYYQAEQGNYDAALQSAQGPQGMLRRLLRPGGSHCRDYQSVVDVLVADGDFSRAQAVCKEYRNACGAMPETGLCFSYSVKALDSATAGGDSATALAAEARERLHFRWLTIRDDYEGNALTRPIY